MLVFDPMVLLFWIIATMFIPGIIISVSLFRKSELWLIEKIVIGCAIGFVLQPMVPFLLSFAGVNYSYAIAIFGTAVLYALAAGLAFKAGLHKEATMETLKKAIPSFEEMGKNPTKYALIVLLLAIVVIAYLMRVQSYSPIYYELDPYFYTYAPQQLLTLGQVPLTDDTAWWPEVQSSHRSSPPLAYLEASWYSFYTQGGTYNNYLMSTIASVYPAIAAAFAVFFLYLFVAAQYRREYALIAAGIIAFVPIFIYKLLAGVMEVQPYAFFALSFFLATYAWAIRQKSRELAIVAGIAYSALVLGTATASVTSMAWMAFIAIYSILLFIKAKNSDEIKEFILLNAIIIAIGPVFSDFLHGAYTANYGFDTAIALIAILVFTAVLYLIKKKEENKELDKELAIYILGGLLLAGLVLLMFTPVGDRVKNMMASGLSIAKYNVPLQKTIAEQPPAGAEFEQYLGYIAFVPVEGDISNILLVPLSGIANSMLSFIYSSLNSFLNVGLEFGGKSTSLILVIILFSILALTYSAYRSMRASPTLFALYGAILFATMLVGLLKLKYVIYFSFFAAGMIGVILGETELVLNGIIRRIAESNEDRKTAAKAVFTILVLTGAALVLMQYQHKGVSPTMLVHSMDMKFEQNPAAFKSKFTGICSQLAAQGADDNALCNSYAQMGVPICSTYDENICTVSQDPVTYANKGINEQYSTKLCYYSLMDNVFKPTPEELSNAQVKCRPLSNYWIESMEWIKNNVEPDARITSWWDYGHWINFFGQRNTVLRNEHSSLNMIGAVAKGYLNDTPEELAKWMKAHGSEYALFDVEINGIEGGKYHALNYLSCAYMNETDVSKGQMDSLCEYEHLWETVYVPKNIPNQGCTISTIDNRTGLLAYKSKVEQVGNTLNKKMEPYYCTGQTTASDGTKMIAVYYLNQKNPNGDLKLNKGFLRQAGENEEVYIFSVLYSKDKAWVENGEAVDGWEDRKGMYYDSNIYRAFYLEDLPGFKLVFKTKDGAVKIYKLIE